MKVDLNKKLVNMEGETIQFGKNPLTLRVAIINALLVEHPDRKLSPDQKVKAYKLAMRVSKEKEESINLKADEIVFIQEGAAVAWSTLVYGQLVEMLGD